MNPEAGSEEPSFGSPAGAAGDSVVVEEPTASPPPINSLTSRFCRRCGTAWDVQADQCPACAAASLSPAPPSVPAISGARLVRLALSLYFAILGSTLAFWLAEPRGADGILILETLQTVLVLIWTVVFWTGIRPLLTTLSRPVFYAAAPALAVVTFGAATLAIHFAVTALGLREYKYALPFLLDGYGWGTILLSVCVQPAIIEEIAFRGVIFSAMERILSPRDAILISALLFMVIHLSAASFPHLLLIGLVLGWLRWRTGSLYPGMVLHFTHNLFCVLVERLQEVSW